MPRVMLLDFDDTLADSTFYRMSAIQQAVRDHLGLEMTLEAVAQATLRHSNIEEIMESLAAGSGLGPKMVRSFRERYYGGDRGPLKLFPGVEDALAQLHRRGVVLGLVTSKYREREEDGLRWGVLQELAALRIGGHFAAVVGYEDTQDHKPHPAPFLKALELLRVLPRGAVAVGDSPLDIRAARAAGVTAAAALWGALDRDALLAAGPDLALEHPGQLLGLA